MSYAVDTNVLARAVQENHPMHRIAKESVKALNALRQQGTRRLWGCEYYKHYSSSGAGSDLSWYDRVNG